MTTVVLARHGQSVWHAEDRYAGVSDIPLTATGMAEAAALAAWAARARPAVVASSDLRRALDTARQAAAACDLEVVVDRRFREVDFGAGEGVDLETLAVAYPQAVGAFRRAPASCPFPGAERGVDAAERGWQALLDLTRAHAGGTILLVAHSTLIRLLLCRLLSIPLDEYRRAFPFLANASLTTVRFDGDGRGGLLDYNVPLRRDGIRDESEERR